jgi:hypothetical protein
MDMVKNWWGNPLPIGVKFVLLVLLANGLPAFLILMSVPDLTDQLFVWTIDPELNARLIGVMYDNALLLVRFAVLQTSWAKVRVIMVVITLFSTVATVLTFFYLKPFLAHPWYHLAYCLSLYLVLFFAAPYIFIKYERIYRGKLQIQLPLTMSARVLAIVSLVISPVFGLVLLFAGEAVSQALPWTLSPLVGGLIGVLFIAHAAAYSWAVWDGDWLRVTEWTISILATALLIIAPNLSSVPLVISFLLYAPWVWGSGLWVLRRKPVDSNQMTGITPAF